jgi:aspartyl/asparaginyl beta-hydroxylase (cupin superfamily)
MAEMGDERQAFCFESEQLSALDGESYFFENQVPHWVVNNSDRDRITLIVCVRRETCH